MEISAFSDSVTNTWNTPQPESAISAGNRIISVDGLQTDPELMLNELRTNSKTDMMLLRQRWKPFQLHTDELQRERIRERHLRVLSTSRLTHCGRTIYRRRYSFSRVILTSRLSISCWMHIDCISWQEKDDYVERSMRVIYTSETLTDITQVNEVTPIREGWSGRYWGTCLVITYWSNVTLRDSSFLRESRTYGTPRSYCVDVLRSTRRKHERQYLTVQDFRWDASQL